MCSSGHAAYLNTQAIRKTDFSSRPFLNPFKEAALLFFSDTGIQIPQDILTSPNKSRRIIFVFQHLAPFFVQIILFFVQKIKKRREKFMQRSRVFLPTSSIFLFKELFYSFLIFTPFIRKTVHNKFIPSYSPTAVASIIPKTPIIPLSFR